LSSRLLENVVHLADDERGLARRWQALNEVKMSWIKHALLPRIYRNFDPRGSIGSPAAQECRRGFWPFIQRSRQILRTGMLALADCATKTPYVARIIGLRH